MPWSKPATICPRIKICLATLGSDGDVQPYLALARGLLARGHDVHLAAVKRYAARAAALGVPFIPVCAAWDDAVMQDRFAAVRAEKNPMRQLTRVTEAISGELAAMVPEFCDIVSDHDLLVSHPLQLAAVAASRVTGRPYVGCHLTNTVRSRNVNPMGSDLGRMLNAFSWTVARWIARRATDRPLNRPIRAAGLPPWRDVFFESSHSGLLDLLAVSPCVIPRDPLWPASYVSTGYWFLDEPSFEPDPELAAFVAAEPPVVITFGSMAGVDARRHTEKIVDGLRRLGRAAVLQAGWANLGEGPLPPHVHRVGFVPHGWLFPRAACVVHHGGAGTSAAALRAGVPQVIVWHMGDQPTWGRLMTRLGVAPAARSHHALDGPWLASTLTHVLADVRMKTRATELGALVRAEDGVGTAVRLIEGLKS